MTSVQVQPAGSFAQRSNGFVAEVAAMLRLSVAGWCHGLISRVIDRSSRSSTGPSSGASGISQATPAAGRNRKPANRMASRESPTFENSPKNTVPKPAAMRPKL